MLTFCTGKTLNNYMKETMIVVFFQNLSLIV